MPKPNEGRNKNINSLLNLVTGGFFRYLTWTAAEALIRRRSRDVRDQAAKWVFLFAVFVATTAVIYVITTILLDRSIQKLGEVMFPIGAASVTIALASRRDIPAYIVLPLTLNVVQSLELNKLATQQTLSPLLFLTIIAQCALILPALETFEKAQLKGLFSRAGQSKMFSWFSPLASKVPEGLSQFYRDYVFAIAAMLLLLTAKIQVGDSEAIQIDSLRDLLGTPKTTALAAFSLSLLIILLRTSSTSTTSGWGRSKFTNMKENFSIILSMYTLLILVLIALARFSISFGISGTARSFAIVDIVFISIIFYTFLNIGKRLRDRPEYAVFHAVNEIIHKSTGIQQIVFYFKNFGKQEIACSIAKEESIKLSEGSERNITCLPGTTTLSFEYNRESKNKPGYNSGYADIEISRRGYKHRLYYSALHVSGIIEVKDRLGAGDINRPTQPIAQQTSRTLQTDPALVLDRSQQRKPTTARAATRPRSGESQGPLQRPEIQPGKGSGHTAQQRTATRETLPQEPGSTKSYLDNGDDTRHPDRHYPAKKKNFTGGAAQTETKEPELSIIFDRMFLFDKIVFDPDAIWVKEINVGLYNLSPKTHNVQIWNQDALRNQKIYIDFGLPQTEEGYLEVDPYIHIPKALLIRFRYSEIERTISGNAHIVTELILQIDDFDRVYLPIVIDIEPRIYNDSSDDVVVEYPDGSTVGVDAGGAGTVMGTHVPVRIRGANNSRSYLARINSGINLISHLTPTAESIERRSFIDIALLGLSGSGKTTFVTMLGIEGAKPGLTVNLISHFGDKKLDREFELTKTNLAQNGEFPIGTPASEFNVYSFTAHFRGSRSRVAIRDIAGEYFGYEKRSFDESLPKRAQVHLHDVDYIFAIIDTDPKIAQARDHDTLVMLRSLESIDLDLAQIRVLFTKTDKSRLDSNNYISWLKENMPETTSYMLTVFEVEDSQPYFISVGDVADGRIESYGPRGVVDPVRDILIEPKPTGAPEENAPNQTENAR